MRTLSWTTGVTGLIAVFCAIAEVSAEPTEIESGLIEGVVLDEASGLQVFRGIPFAAPPVGDLRWREPQRAATWDGVRVCDTFSKICPQYPALAAMTGEALPETDEDCLYLNVWTNSAGKAEAKLPVMVWIHGGGLNLGWSHQNTYDGVALAQRDVVLVSINYRLGPFGFFAHPDLSKESENHSSGNYGLLDQIAALQWVERNIAQFGGDPDNVTIFGESAGGTSVYALCLTPLAEGLFDRAIAQSAWVTSTNFVPLSESANEVLPREALGEQLAVEWLGKPSGDPIAELRGMDAQDLLERGGEGYVPAIAIDNWFMPDFPDSILARGAQHDVPVMAGVNRDEGTLFATNVPYKTVEDYAQSFDTYGALAGEVRGLYSATTTAEIRAGMVQHITDAWFVRGTRALLRAMDKVDSAAYYYHFTRTGPVFPFLGAHHAAELNFVFNTIPEGRGKEWDRELEKAMIAYWVQFARTGNPNVEGLPAWPAYSPESDQHLVLGDAIETGTGIRNEACDILDRAQAAHISAVTGTD